MLNEKKCIRPSPKCVSITAATNYVPPARGDCRRSESIGSSPGWSVKESLAESFAIERVSGKTRERHV